MDRGPRRNFFEGEGRGRSRSNGVSGNKRAERGEFATWAYELPTGAGEGGRVRSELTKMEERLTLKKTTNSSKLQRPHTGITGETPIRSTADLHKRL